MIGVRTTHHCHNGLLPLLVAPSQSVGMTEVNTSSFSLCPGPSAGPHANEELGQQNETVTLVGGQRIFATVVPLT